MSTARRPRRSTVPIWDWCARVDLEQSVPRNTRWNTRPAVDLEQSVLHSRFRADFRRLEWADLAARQTERLARASLKASVRQRSTMFIRPTSSSTNATTQVAGGASPKENGELDRACADFEAVFLRQLLEVSKVGAQAGKSGYGSMVVDALATSINDAGGLGLAESIRTALEAKPSAR